MSGVVGVVTSLDVKDIEVRYSPETGSVDMYQLAGYSDGGEDFILVGRDQIAKLIEALQECQRRNQEDHDEAL